MSKPEGWISLDGWEPEPPPAPAPVPHVEELPEWAELVAAINDDGGTVDCYRRHVTGMAAALVRAWRRTTQGGES